MLAVTPVKISTPAGAAPCTRRLHGQYGKHAERILSIQLVVEQLVPAGL